MKIFKLWVSLVSWKNRIQRLKFLLHNFKFIIYLLWSWSILARQLKIIFHFIETIDQSNFTVYYFLFLFVINTPQNFQTNSYQVVFLSSVITSFWYFGDSFHLPCFYLNLNSFFLALQLFSCSFQIQIMENLFYLNIFIELTSCPISVFI